MIARSTKKILRANIATYMFQKFRTGIGLDEEEEATLSGNTSIILQKQDNY
jgi:hypothetical protein